MDENTSNNALHYYFSVNTKHGKMMRACDLHSLPDRRTFDKRFKALPIQDIISLIGQRFLIEGIVERDAAADSAIIQCKKAWHKSDMRKWHIHWFH